MPPAERSRDCCRRSRRLTELRWFKAAAWVMLSDPRRSLPRRFYFVRMVRIDRRRAARASGDARTGRGAHPHSIVSIFARVRRLCLPEVLVGDHRRAAADGVDADRAPGRPAVANHFGGPSAFSFVRAPREDNLSRPSSIGLRRSPADVVVANAGGDGMGHTPASEANTVLWFGAGLEGEAPTATPWAPRVGELGAPASASILLHRPTLDSRRKVANFLRAMIAADEVDTLRAIFVDEQTRLVRFEHLGSARDFWPTDRYRRLFDQGYTAGAAGVIFARGHRAGSPFVTAEERCLALDLARHGASLDVPVLDYIVIGGTEAKGVLAIHEVDRL